MADYSYSDFISKKIIFATTVGGHKPLLKQSEQLFPVVKKSAPSNKSKSVNISSVVLKKQKKTSSF